MAERTVNWLAGIIVNPVDTLRDISQQKPIGWGILIYLVVSFLSVLTANGDIPPAMKPWIVISSPVLAIITLFIYSGLYHLFARLFGGTGDFWGLFSAVSFTSFVFIFLPPLNLLSQLGGIVAVLTMGLLSFAVGIWNLVLEVIAVRENHQISTGLSVLTVLIPLVILIILALVLLLVIGAAVYLFFAASF